MNIDWIEKMGHMSVEVKNFVDGRWKEACRGELIEKRSPRDGCILCTYGSGDQADADEAVSSARTAFEDGRWSTLASRDRKAVLYRLAELIDRHADELAILECLDVGKPISDAVEFDVPVAAMVMRSCAEMIDHVYSKVYSANPSGLSYQLRRPIGVVAGITGWNFPLVLAAQKIGPALASGNSLVLKPSEVTSLSSARIAELAVQAGVPTGILNVIHGGPKLGAALACHDDVDLLTFTGSSRTGKLLMVAAGESNMKHLLLECGGKAPNIVFDDAPNVESVAKGIVRRAFWNQGQVCTASSRLLVHRGIKAELLAAVIKIVSSITLGDPLRAETTFGAVVSQAHRAKVLNYIRFGQEDGANVAFWHDGKAPHIDGYYVAPVILDGVLPNHRVAREEIFGPVLSVLEFDEERDAVRIANSTAYGLSAIVWTKDAGRAHRMAQQIRAGWICINSTGDPTDGTGLGVLSMGGHKQSGIGVEGGIEGMEEYMSKTAVQHFV